MKTFFKWYQNILFILACILLIAIVLPLILGLRSYVVLSGSMEPLIHTGAVCYIKKGNTETQYDVHDIVAFSPAKGTAVVHRLIDYDAETQLYTTKGDANDTQDIAPIMHTDIIGEFVFSIPYLGYAVKWMQSGLGKIILVCAIALSIISSVVYREKPKKKKDTDILCDEARETLSACDNTDERNDAVSEDNLQLPVNVEGKVQITAKLIPWLRNQWINISIKSSQYFWKIRAKIKAKKIRAGKTQGAEIKTSIERPCRTDHQDENSLYCKLQRIKFEHDHDSEA